MKCCGGGIGRRTGPTSSIVARMALCTVHLLYIYTDRAEQIEQVHRNGLLFESLRNQLQQNAAHV